MAHTQQCAAAGKPRAASRRGAPCRPPAAARRRPRPGAPCTGSRPPPPPRPRCAACRRRAPPARRRACGAGAAAGASSRQRCIRARSAAPQLFRLASRSCCQAQAEQRVRRSSDCPAATAATPNCHGPSALTAPPSPPRAAPPRPCPSCPAASPGPSAPWLPAGRRLARAAAVGLGARRGARAGASRRQVPERRTRLWRCSILPRVSAPPSPSSSLLPLSSSAAEAGGSFRNCAALLGAAWGSAAGACSVEAASGTSGASSSASGRAPRALFTKPARPPPLLGPIAAAALLDGCGRGQESDAMHQLPWRIADAPRRRLPHCAAAARLPASSDARPRHDTGDLSEMCTESVTLFHVMMHSVVPHQWP